MKLLYEFKRTRVKICGFTKVRDARQAASLGVDAIGLVFYPLSSRNVNIPTAQEIVRSLPPFISVVALFVDECEKNIREILSQVNINLIQFHGEETPEFCQSFGIPYIKAIRMRENVDIDEKVNAYSGAKGLLLDAYHPGVKGGSGIRFDWARIPKQCKLPIILAGGLSPRNVAMAMETVKPYGLDVSSGVELAPGIKDSEKMESFLQEVRKFDCKNK